MLFVVLDTVRSDHLSACGYGRPTSPTLETLVKMGATLSCEATTPGTWTVPSHASYFTGLDVASHGAHYVADSALTFGDGIGLSPLRPEPETLAEAFAARGYQTASLSGNPLIRQETGLARGFQHVRHGDKFGDLAGERHTAALVSLLREDLDPTKPLFLFLNIADAHQPWEGVPADAGWLPARAPFSMTPAFGDMPRFLRGELAPEEEAVFLEHLVDAYDWGVFRADRTLGAALGALRAHGWLDAETRIVLTSDHGEFLGEHGLLDHGRYVWQEDVQVPLLLLGPGLPAALPAPLSAMDAHALVLEGALETPSPVRVAAWPDGSWMKHLDGELGSHTTAALVLGTEKLVWTDGALQRFDLRADPGEATPLPLDEDHPGRAALLGWAQEVEADKQRALAMDPALLEALRAAGYME
ncbi:MAG: sulfatase-like hydrolase/transferase [Alphaproteobacteria bacterium]|nr:sulfatase-like hydrolase/transferase [Alphaproteobacteria bacterium]MCB9793204.1 sulfatase-like hydrolase/transferase [Alphaproteobacteria bacterium]